MIYMFLSNNPSSGDINSSNLSCCSGNLYPGNFANSEVKTLPDLFAVKAVEAKIAIVLTPLSFLNTVQTYCIQSENIICCVRQNIQ